MVYIALLRGINVGGNARVEMSRLKGVFEAIGFENVSTYINSGNVVFSSDKTPDCARIEQAIHDEFSLEVPVLIRDLENIKLLVKHIPSSWVNDSEQKTDVLFLWAEVDQETIVDDIGLREEIENHMVLDGALIWNIQREYVTRSRMLKIVGTKIYKQMTVRNINTVRTLYEKMSKIESTQ